jgi:hypothetical protein
VTIEKSLNEKELISLSKAQRGNQELLRELYNLEKALKYGIRPNRVIEYFSFFSTLPKGNQNSRQLGRSDRVKRGITATIHLSRI